MNSPLHAAAAALFAALALSAAPVQAATVYTGDIIQGKRVVSELDVNDLEAGKLHRLFFQGVQMGTGQHWYLPVVVAKGGKAVRNPSPDRASRQAWAVCPRKSSQSRPEARARKASWRYVAGMMLN